MTPPLVSVLIPIYNVESYLSQCLDSVCHQTLKDLEIICINDGSTDSSLAIIKRYQAKDPRIILIDKPNTGYGDSMNQGIKRATAPYLAIVEPDDWIEEAGLQSLYRLAREYDVDVVRANYYHFSNGKDTKYSYIPPTDTLRVIDPSSHIWIFYQAPAIWSALYRRQFLLDHDIKFLPTPGASYQDTGFNFKVWASTKRACFTTDAFLHYRLDNENSSVNNPGKVMNVSTEYAEIERYLKANHLLTPELGAIFVTAKFGAYYWNIMRLQPKLLDPFLKQVKTELEQAQADGYLVREYFPDPAKWALANTILHSTPAQIRRAISRQKIQQKLRSVAKSAFIRTHPSYRKQKAAAELIESLLAEQAALRTRLQKLEAELEKTK